MAHFVTLIHPIFYLLLIISYNPFFINKINHMFFSFGRLHNSEGLKLCNLHTDFA